MRLRLDLFYISESFEWNEGNITTNWPTAVHSAKPARTFRAVEMWFTSTPFLYFEGCSDIYASYRYAGNKVHISSNLTNIIETKLELQDVASSSDFFLHQTCKMWTLLPAYLNILQNVREGIIFVTKILLFRHLISIL